MKRLIIKGTRYLLLSTTLALLSFNVVEASSSSSNYSSLNVHHRSWHDTMKEYLASNDPYRSLMILDLLTAENPNHPLGAQKAPTREDFNLIFEAIISVMKDFGGNFLWKDFILDHLNDYKTRSPAFKDHMERLYLIGRYIQEKLSSDDISRDFLIGKIQHAPELSSSHIGKDINAIATDYLTMIETHYAAYILTKNSGINLPKVKENKKIKTFPTLEGSNHITGGDNTLMTAFWSKGVIENLAHSINTFNANFLRVDFDYDGTDYRVRSIETPHKRTERSVPFIIPDQYDGSTKKQRLDGFLYKKYAQYMTYFFIIFDDENNRDHVVGYLDPRQSIIVPREDFVSLPSGQKSNMILLSSGSIGDHAKQKIIKLDDLITDDFKGALYPIQECNLIDDQQVTHSGFDFLQVQLNDTQNILGAPPFILENKIPTGYSPHYFEQRGVYDLNENLIDLIKIQENDPIAYLKINKKERIRNILKLEPGEINNELPKLQDILQRGKFIEYTPVEGRIGYQNGYTETLIDYGHPERINVRYLTSSNAFKTMYDRSQDPNFHANNKFFLIQRNNDIFGLQFQTWRFFDQPFDNLDSNHKNYYTKYMDDLYQYFYTDTVLYRLEKKESKQWKLHKESDGVMGPDMYDQLSKLITKIEKENIGVTVTLQTLDPVLGYEPHQINPNFE